METSRRASDEGLIEAEPLGENQRAGVEVINLDLAVDLFQQ